MCNNLSRIQIQYDTNIVGSVIVMIVCNIAYPNRVGMVYFKFLFQNIFFALLIHQIKCLGTVSHTEHIGKYSIS